MEDSKNNLPHLVPRRVALLASAALLASDSNPLHDPKEWDLSGRGDWGHLPEFWADAGSLPGNLMTHYAHLARHATIFQGPRMRQLA